MRLIGGLIKKNIYILGEFKSIKILERVLSFPPHFCVYFPLFSSPSSVWQSGKIGR